MNTKYTVLTIFQYSTEAQVVKSKLDSQGIKTMLMDEKTIDSDPLMSQAIGGVKLLVYTSHLKKAMIIYDEIREYKRDEQGNPIFCPNCNSHQILIAPLQRKNIFYMLFPFFEKIKYICNHCKTVF